MIVVQLLLLKVSLDNRPSHSSKGGESSLPFAGSREGELGVSRPYNFWQWRSQKPWVTDLLRMLIVLRLKFDVHRYWQFLLYLFIILTALELFFSPSPSLYSIYSSAIGYLGLSIEAILPVPQILSNNRTRSCKGFRFSVLASWIAGDVFKMFWFFSAQTPIPWSFKLCGIFQMACDFFLGIQYWMYGDGSTAILKDNLNVELREHDSGMSNASHRSS